MCIFVNRRKGPSTNAQTNIQTYRTKLNNLKQLPARLAFFNMKGSHIMDMKNDLPSSVCFFDLSIFVNFVKTDVNPQITGDDLLILFYLAA
jgi:hypothetical protein